MIAFIKRRIGVKLFLSYLLVVLAGGLAMLAVSQVSLPGAFNRHLSGMGQMMLEAPGMMGTGIQQRAGGGPGALPELYGNFRAGFNDALAYAGLAAIVGALAISLFFSRVIIRPLREMMQASQRIAEGNYRERVQVSGSDELSQLSGHFNHMAESLEQVEAMRRQLIGDVSHELRTPLTSIKGMVEGLMDGVLPQNEETYSHIQREAERLSRLVDDLQELSRVEAGAVPLELNLLDVKSALETVLRRLQMQFEEKEITCAADIPPDLPEIMADEDRFIQIMTNLLGNALQYTPSGGVVRLDAGKNAQGVWIAVTDNGQGIAPEHLVHIFTRFYRVDKSRSRQAGGGSGIGLTVVKSLVEAHGGSVRAESTGLGKGSRFEVIFPLG